MMLSEEITEVDKLHMKDRTGRQGGASNTRRFVRGIVCRAIGEPPWPRTVCASVAADLFWKALTKRRLAVARSGNGGGKAIAIQADAADAEAVKNAVGAGR